MTAYHAVALQARCDAVNATLSRDEARALMVRSLDRIKSQVNAAITWVSREDWVQARLQMRTIRNHKANRRDAVARVLSRPA